MMCQITSSKRSPSWWNCWSRRLMCDWSSSAKLSIKWWTLVRFLNTVEQRLSTSSSARQMLTRRSKQTLSSWKWWIWRNVSPFMLRRSSTQKLTWCLKNILRRAKLWLSCWSLTPRKHRWQFWRNLSRHCSWRKTRHRTSWKIFASASSLFFPNALSRSHLKSFRFITTSCVTTWKVLTLQHVSGHWRLPRPTVFSTSRSQKMFTWFLSHNYSRAITLSSGKLQSTASSI